MTCTAKDIDDILHMRGSSPMIVEITEKVKRDIADNSLRDSLNVDVFPLSLEQYKVITSKFIEDMSWDKVMLLFKIGMFVDLNEREEVARHLADTYCGWIVRNGGLGRCLSRRCWSRLWQRQ
jgi:hypothetical protein